MRQKTRKDVQSVALSTSHIAPCFSTWCGLLLSFCLLVSARGNATVRPGVPDNRAVDTSWGSSGRTHKIQHVVVIFQENRTPDNLFHGLPGADIANGGFNSKGEYIPLTPVSLHAWYDLDHSHGAFMTMYDHGKMDRADKIGIRCGMSQGCPANPQFKYVNPSDVAPYFKLAKTYTFADRMFQTNQGPSFPAHQFIISGTSAPTATSKLFASENPFRQSGPPKKSTFSNSGCASSEWHHCESHRSVR